jgi:hypothetical protein
MTDTTTETAPSYSSDAEILASLSPSAEVEALSEDSAVVEEETQAEAAAAESTLNLAKLQEIAEKRQASRQAQTQSTQDAGPPPLTAEAIAEAMRSTDSFRQQVAAAVKGGDLEALARLVDGDKADPAGVYERFTSKALNPDGHAVKSELQQLREEVAALKASAGKVPDGVMTEEKLQEREAIRARAASEAAFTSMVTEAADTYPFLAHIDSALALEYAWKANDLLTAHAEETGQAFSLEDVSRVAEEIASSKLQRLRAHNAGAAAATQGGTTTTKAARAATAGGTRAGGGIDNRAASTTAATMPDPDDENAWEQRAMAIARAAKG